MATTTKRSETAGCFALIALLVGVVALVVGFGLLAGSHGDQASVTCNNTPMQPGDTCTTYRNGSVEGTSSYDEVRDEHLADLRSDATWGPVWLTGGAVLLGVGVVTIALAYSADRRARRR